MGAPITVPMANPATILPMLEAKFVNAAPDTANSHMYASTALGGGRILALK